jgi:hypothetical protein
MQDSTAILIAALGGLSSAIASIASVLVAFRTHGRVVELEHNTNSIKDALVKVTGESEHAKGVIQGASEQARKEERSELDL